MATARARKARAQGARKTARPVRPNAGRASAHDKALRTQILYLLRGGGAHLEFDKVIADWPPELRGIKPAELPFTAWRLLEHLRIAQWDILEFSRNPKYVSPPFPDGYWPESLAPPSPEAWNQSVAAFRADLKAMERLVANPKTDLHARIPHGEGQTILREALVVADHNAYHLGQLVTLRRLLGAWKD